MKCAPLYIPDLFFAPRVADALKQLGLETRDVNVRGDLAAQLGRAALLVVQLDRPRETWLKLIEAARESGVPVLAFGRHTEAETLRAARSPYAARRRRARTASPCSIGQVQARTRWCQIRSWWINCLNWWGH